MAKKNKFAVFGAGCFWGVESSFRAVEGVVDVAVGYAGCDVAKPSYRQVCTGKTGHAEVVQVEYDPARVTFAQLVEVFWQIHDPTRMSARRPRNQNGGSISPASLGARSSRRLCRRRSSIAPRNIISAITSGWVSHRPAESTDEPTNTQRRAALDFFARDRTGGFSTAMRYAC